MNKSETFEREDRYVVIKRKHLSETQERWLMDFLEQSFIEQVPLAVVVEGDWPEYEPVWSMIEKRVTGENEDAGCTVHMRFEGQWPKRLH